MRDSPLGSSCPMPSNQPGPIIRFGIFELDLLTGELRKAGIRLPLQEQPLQILTLLLQRPGQLVTRDELRQRLWATETFGDFEHGLNAAVARLRETLGDSADAPTFVETLPRRGYRFIAPLRDAGLISRQEPGSTAIPHGSFGRSGTPTAETTEGGLSESPRALNEVLIPREPTANQWRPVSPRQAVVAALVLVSAGIAVMIATRLGGHSRSRAPSPIRVLLDLQPAETVGPPLDQHVWTRGGSRTAFTWTPDASGLVFVGSAGDSQQLYLRRLDAVDAKPIAGTDGARAPAVSPDGKWVAFWADDAIRRVPLSGGPVEILQGDGPPSGIAFAGDGHVFYSTPQQGPIRQIAAGKASDVTRLGAGELNHALPALLPGDRVLLYTVRRRVWTWGDEDVVAYDRVTGATKVLLHDATDARYVQTGHLLFLRRGKLFAVPFDPIRLEIDGQPAAVLDDVAQSLAGINSGDLTGAGQFAVASNGALAWLPSTIAFYPEASLVFSDRQGRVTQLPAPVANYAGPLRVSPDGRQLAVGIHTIENITLALYDTVRGTLTPLTAAGEANLPIWSPDGGRLIFSWLTRGRQTIAWQPVDGSAPAQALMSDEGVAISWFPDGRKFSIVKYSGGVEFASLAAGGKLTLEQPTNLPDGAEGPEFSPDGHWLAYGADLSGRPAIYLQAYPGPSPRIQVSNEQAAGSHAWSSDGRELFYMGCEGGDAPCRLMVVDVRDSPKLTLSRPRPLFSITPTAGLLFGCSPARCYDVDPDGKRFYTIQKHRRASTTVATHINIVFNWLNEVQEAIGRQDSANPDAITPGR
jgi:eukaryotic-like serine/threonine-protein kinase